jgi:tRNA threonylcarbamoyl adenosine modification protein YeaZ
MKDELKFLQIDTSNENFLFIKLVNKKTQKHILINEKRCHMKELVPSIQKLLESEELVLTDLDFIALNEGPGSWTGLRIGFSTVKTFWQVTKVKVIFYSNFELLTYKYKTDTGVFLVKSSNDKYYYQVLNKGELYGQNIISKQELEDFYNTLPRYFFDENEIEADSLLVEKYKNNEFPDVNSAEPYYIVEGVIFN